jgi:hypothetical protein
MSRQVKRDKYILYEGLYLDELNRKHFEEIAIHLRNYDQPAGNLENHKGITRDWYPCFIPIGLIGAVARIDGFVPVDAYPSPKEFDFELGSIANLRIIIAPNGILNAPPNKTFKTWNYYRIMACAPHKKPIESLLDGMKDENDPRYITAEISVCKEPKPKDEPLYEERMKKIGLIK